MTPNQTLDARDLRCPMPVLKANKCLREMKAGELLEVLATDEAALRDMPDYCEKSGHRLMLAETRADGVHRFLLCKQVRAN